LVKINEPAIIERLAIYKIEINSPTEAVLILEELLKNLKENRPSLYTNLIAAHNKLGQFDKALSYADKYNNIKYSWQFHLNKANSLMALERINEAEEILSKLYIENHKNYTLPTICQECTFYPNDCNGICGGCLEGN
jgi:tetratricopeptide (TPR) repeat protein